MLILGTVIAVILSAFFYRLGGMSKKEAHEKLPWVPDWLIDGWVRDAFCTIVTMAWALAFYKIHWALAICAGLMYGAITTYWDSVPCNKGKDNFYMHGFFIALAMFPVVIVTGNWLGFGIRCVALALAMGILCQLFGNVDVEEYGRGGLIAATLPLMLI